MFSFNMIGDGVLAPLGQLNVGRVTVPVDQLESSGESASAAVNFVRNGNDNDALTALGCKNDTRWCP